MQFKGILQFIYSKKIYFSKLFFILLGRKFITDFKSAISFQEIQLHPVQIFNSTLADLA